jgi:hypothetical protein
MPPAELEARLAGHLHGIRERRAAPKRQSPNPSRVRRSLISLTAVSALVIFTAISALAVHDNGIFELDGNIADNPPGGPTDWGAFQDTDGSLIEANLPAGTLAATGVIQDFVPGDTGPDDSYHEPSNHDQQGIDPAGGSDVWGCTSAANPTDKDDIVNAYALAVEQGGDTYVYFGTERFDNSGTAFVGVWLFQADVGCDTATGKFTGEKQTGDILILTNFTNGGVITELEAWAFTAGATPADEGTFDLITSSVDCDDPALPADHTLCANVNTGDVTTPWPMEDKEKPGPPNPDPPNILEISEFFEGGINLTETFEDAGLDPPECLGSFLAETRSSDVLLGATLKDYALGDFDTCGDITAHKYHDLNANGVDDDDPDLSGWTIFLDENGNEILDAGEQSAVTDANGDVSFGELPFGDYDVCEVLQASWFNSDPAGATLCETVTVSAANDPYVDFGNFQQGTKSGTKFEDPNADGDLTDGTALPGWVINAYLDDGDGILSAGEFAAGVAATDTTDANGDYSFSLDPGDYIVCEELPADWFQSAPNPGTADCSAGTGLAAAGYAVTITSGSSEEDNDFGNFQQGTKSGSKFNDTSMDGIWDGTEPGLAGWTINVYNDNDNSDTLSLGDTLEATTVTADGTGADPLGFYSFILDPGEYVVCEVLQTDWVQSAPSGNTACDFDAIDATLADAGFAVTISSGSSEENNDFGNFQPPSEGCTPGFWQGGFGKELWNEDNDADWGDAGGDGVNPFKTTDKFNSFALFTPTGNATVDNMTMLQIVGSGGTNVWARKAARDLIAAYLNASFGLDYPYDLQTILDDWDTAVAGGTAGFQAFHLKYAAANQLGCPIGQTATATTLASTSASQLTWAGVMAPPLLLFRRRRLTA